MPGLSLKCDSGTTAVECDHVGQSTDLTDLGRHASPPPPLYTLRENTCGEGVKVVSFFGYCKKDILGS